LEGTGEILGGYNSLEWEKNNDQRKRTKENFIFSLKTANIKNSILSRASECGSVNNYPSSSELSFGYALRLIDNLKTEKRCYCMNSRKYPKPIRSSEFMSISPGWGISEKSLFSVEEYE
ncbi:4883_t:CDS:1, partial [Dentiscutata erythropus]